LVRFASVGWRDSDAHAGADDDLMTDDVERLGNRRDDPPRKLGRIGRPRASLNDGELVAAEAGDGIRATHRELQPLGDLAKQRIADRMPERIVDALKPVEIDKQD